MLKITELAGGFQVSSHLLNCIMKVYNEAKQKYPLQRAPLVSKEPLECLLPSAQLPCNLSNRAATWALLPPVQLWGREAGAVHSALSTPQAAAPDKTACRESSLYMLLAQAELVLPVNHRRWHKFKSKSSRCSFASEGIRVQGSRGSHQREI